MEIDSDGSLASNAWAIDSVVAGRKEDMAAARTKFCKKIHFVNGEKPESQRVVHYYQLLSERYSVSEGDAGQIPLDDHGRHG